MLTLSKVNKVESSTHVPTLQHATEIAIQTWEIIAERGKQDQANRRQFVKLRSNSKMTEGQVSQQEA